ncbi:hypothetical protein MC378_04320 [Polaribacter sp. MSW13]|uniref:Cobalamin-binding protein n=1 Tax=Polaribacter marinus TaxID=2916838 RepID=A0A9X1VLK2_9FLAO|nr:hypothetical protein [Polaribacter marinus]MCI2228381.1 hypothetical protein [Polaribacter marinus]
MEYYIEDNDVFGLIRPENDIHTLGISTFGKIIEDCGYKVVIGNAIIAKAVADISDIHNLSLLEKWIFKNNITILGFSYRLDPKDAQTNFGKVYYFLKDKLLLAELGGPIKSVHFAGLPEACKKIKQEYNNKVSVFIGDETQLETLKKFNVPENKIPTELMKGSKYDDARMDFSQDLILSRKYNFVTPPKRIQYPSYGSFKDTLVEKITYNKKESNLPLMRVHVGPYNSNYEEVKKEFHNWLKTLSETKFLDIVSVGSSQLSQSDFGTDWKDKPNGGGVPINSEEDLYKIWEASRPMLVRTYSGTRETQKMAKIYERTINISWHALSFWWFNKIDGRGPHNVLTNLINHIETLKIIALYNKPFEPNIPHHFSFRGGDDYTYILSAYLAAITAKKHGIKYFVLQIMLNTPKYTLGIQDLAKARALLKLVRELEDKNFTVFLQPRAGLDYFSPDLEKARMQLASVTAMMDDIEPENPKSPDIIHVVSYCEAVELATPKIINESIQITTLALKEYRKLKKAGHIDNMINNKDVNTRTEDLYQSVKKIRAIIEENVMNPYSAQGLYEIFKKGVFAVPYLWEGKEEFKDAIKWKTGLYNGGIHVLDDQGKPIDPVKRISNIFLENK